MAVWTYQKDISLKISEDIIISLNQRGADSEPFAELAPPGQYLLDPRCHQVPKHLCHAAVANHVRSRNCHYASRGVGRIALRD
ncbi:hypothetical protein PIB30_026881 [Stylosanthes scabra]|uniref:Uncharacterized protein n=1 Tax=Stylosanthes scabra TaxID=79078 RepID=A0ABU6U9Z7_9FABA|nr:hypothetical protein [Stylosanthes scabra]